MKLENKKKILVITHNNLRHLYFANTILKKCSQFQIELIIGAKLKKEFKKKKKLTKKISNIFFFIFQYLLNKQIVNFEKIFFKNEEKKFKLLSKNKILLDLNGKKNINDTSVIKLIKNYNPYIILNMGSILLIKDLIDSARFSINIHTGLSPYYKGSKTNIWPILDRKYNYLGLTIHFLSTGIDNGDIIYTRRIHFANKSFSLINNTAIVYASHKLALITKYIMLNDRINSVKQWENGLSFKNSDWNASKAFKYYLIIFLNKIINLNKRKTTFPKTISFKDLLNE